MLPGKYKEIRCRHHFDFWLRTVLSLQLNIKCVSAKTVNKILVDFRMTELFKEMLPELLHLDLDILLTKKDRRNTVAVTS